MERGEGGKGEREREIKIKIILKLYSTGFDTITCEGLCTVLVAPFTASEGHVASLRFPLQTTKGAKSGWRSYPK